MLIQEDITESTYIAVLPSPYKSGQRLNKKIPIALERTPEQICGTARRIGIIYEGQDEKALYRLKLSKERVNNAKLATLPGLFLLQGGTFVPYQ